MDRPVTSRRPVRIANCSGFYGDRLDAAKELLDGPDPIDFLTGDYLAELTMLILWKARQADPAAGYAVTFLRQMEEVLGTCLDRRIKVVTNAGGLNPAGLADRLRAHAARVGLSPRIAAIEGDDITDRIGPMASHGWPFENLDTGQPLADAHVEVATANAYLGSSGIVAALDAGADVVICPRVTDAALVVGPAAWWHGWQREDWDRMAGGVVAGHVLECGAQSTGGNYCFPDELEGDRLPGFPIAEVSGDGSSVITKQPGTGGAVTVGTVTAQLLYEISEPRYVTPDAVALFDTVRLEQLGTDRVLINGVRGQPTPDTLKVAINYQGGFRNSMTMVLTGLDVEDKARRAQSMLWQRLGTPEQFEAVEVALVRSDHPDAPTNEEATALLRVTAMDPDREKVGRRFSDAVVELSLSSYAGFYTTTPPSKESSFGVYWPTLVPSSAVHQSVLLDDGMRLPVAPAELAEAPSPVDARLAGRSGEPAGDRLLDDRSLGPPADPGVPGAVTARFATAATARAPLGVVCGARSGDKGGNANVGLWTWDDLAYEWLCSEMSPERLKGLLSEARDLEVKRYELANLRALNFVVVGLLGRGVAASTRGDPQAKGLGEYLRSRVIDVPVELLDRVPAMRPRRRGPARAGGG